MLAFCNESGKTLVARADAQKSIEFLPPVRKHLSGYGSGLHDFCIFINC